MLRSCFATVVAVLIAGATSAVEPQSRIAKVGPLLAKADAAARKWQPDPELVGIYAKLDRAGELDLRRLAVPPNFDGGMLSVTFRSSLAGQECSLTIEPSGEWFAGTALPANPTQVKTPLGSTFMDLDEALAKAKLQGLTLPPTGRPGHIDARLTAVRDANGGVKRSWAFTSLDMTQPFIPKVVSQKVVSADSGKAMKGGEADRTSENNPRMHARPPIDPDLSPPRKTNAARPKSRNEGGFKITETFLATSKKGDLNTFGGSPRGMAVRSGGKIDQGGEVMVSREGAVRVQFNGAFGPSFQVVEEVVVSPDGRHVGYFGMSDDRWKLVIDGRALEIGPRENAADVILNGADIAFSNDGKRWGATAKFLYERDDALMEEHLAIVDGKPVVQPMIRVLKKDGALKGNLFGPGFSMPTFSPKGDQFAFIQTHPQETKSKRTVDLGGGKTQDRYTFGPSKAHIVVDGKPGPEFETVKDLQFSPTGLPSYFAKESNGWRIVQTKSQSGVQKSVGEKLQFSPDGLGLAVTFSDPKLFGNGITERVEVFSREGNWKSATFDEVHGVAIGPRGKPCLVIGEKNKKISVVLDGKEIGTYEFAAEPVVSKDSGRWAYAAKFGEGEYAVVVDGLVGPKGTNVASAVFSDAGTKSAYVVSDKSGSRLIVDGEEHARAPRIASPVFSPGGIKLAYFTWTDPNGFPTVVVDGKPIPGFDRAVHNSFKSSSGAPEAPLLFEGPNAIRFIAQRGDDYFSVSCTIAE